MSTILRRAKEPALPLSHLSAWLAQVVGAPDRRSAPRLPPLFPGALFARGRRTVTSWFRAAGVTTDFRRAYNAPWAAGRRAEAPAHRLLCVALLPPMRRVPGGHLPFAIDDTPTARYGPCVRGAGVHHNPGPGPAGEKFVYGHVWVVLAWLARHPAWHTPALPLRAPPYVRAKHVPASAKGHPREFRTKPEPAAELVRWLTVWLDHVGKVLWLAIDGAYAKRPFLKPAPALGVVVFGRLRKDAHLTTRPPPRRRPGRRGRRRPTARGGSTWPNAPGGSEAGGGSSACSTASGWLRRSRRSRRPGGRRGAAFGVAIVRETDGWLAHFGTDPEATAAAVLEAMADRGAIEQTFKDAKEVWGAGRQLVRNVHASIGALAVSPVLYCPAEAWAWSRAGDELVARPSWDEEERRP